MKNFFFPVLLLTLLFLANFFLFQFQDIPNFRDFVGTDYYYNLEFSVNISNWLHYLFNFLSTQGVNMVTAHEILFAGYFTVGFGFLYLGLRRIIGLIDSVGAVPCACPVERTEDSKGTSLQKIFIILLSLFLLYNPWTFERVLMGQLGIILGYCIIVFNTGLLFESILQNFAWQRSAKFSIAVLLSAFISPHYPIFLLGVFTLFVLYCILQNFFCDRAQNFVPLQSIKSLLIVSVPSFLFFFFRYFGESQNKTFQSSGEKTEILKNFSLWEGGENFYLESLLGKNSWMSDGFIEKFLVAEDLGWMQNFSLYYSYLLQWGFVIFVVLVFCFIVCNFFQLRLLSLSKHKQVFESSTSTGSVSDNIIIFSFIAIPLSLILNFGYSGGFEKINQFFYALPFSYIFRESGKFYAVSLLSMGIIMILFWKYLIGNKGDGFHKIFLIILSVFVASSFLPFLFLAKNLNQPVYPSVFSKLQNECTPDKKILYLPLRQYSTMAYSEDIFMITPDKYLFECTRVDHSFTYLGNTNIILNADEKFYKLQKSIETFSQEVSKKNFLAFQNQLQNNSIDYIIIDITDQRQDTKKILYNLVQYKEVYLYENNVFIFTF